MPYSLLSARAPSTDGLAQYTNVLVREKRGAVVRETERVSALIDHVYDAALDSTLWVDVLDEAARFVGGPAASLYYKDADKRAGIAYQRGLDPRYVQLYIDKYVKLDPSTGYLFAKL